MKNKKKMLEDAKKFAGNLGIEINLDSNIVDGYRKGNQVTWGDLKLLADSKAVVWVVYRKDGEENNRIEGFYRVERLDDGSFYFDDGSFLSFYMNQDEGDDDIVNEYNDGYVKVYLAKLIEVR